MGWPWSFGEESDLRSTPQSCSQSSASCVSWGECVFPHPQEYRSCLRGQHRSRDTSAIKEGSLEEVMPMKSRHSPDKERIERTPQAETEELPSSWPRKP